MRIFSLLCVTIGVLLFGNAAVMSQDVVKQVLRYERSEKNLLDALQARPFESGFEADEDSFVCDNGNDASGRRGVSYWVGLNQTKPEPIFAELWSKCENVSGSPDQNYSLYIDLLYQDGTPQWGQTAPFDTGTHAGQKKNLVIFPEKPVRSLTIYGLFREKSGKAWFRDFHLSTLTVPDDAGVFDSVPMIPQKHATWQIRDVAADSDFLEMKGTPFGIASEIETDGQGLTTVTLKSGDTRDHCLTLVYAVPVPPENLVWCEHPRSSLKIEPDREYMLTNLTSAGANGRLSAYPFAAVATTATPSLPASLGRAVGIDMGMPAFFRTGYNACSGELFVAVDVALTKESPTATLRFVTFDFRGYQAFRGALAKYYELFPQDFECRTPEQGNWMPFAKISNVPNHEDFGFKFKEGNDEVAWDDAHDMITFRYTEPMTWWMSMPDNVTHDYENAVAIARKLADDGNAQAKALFTSGMHDANGRFVCQLLDTPWCKGAVWSINDIPGIENGSFALKWNDRLAERLYSSEGFVGLDGEYVDSSEGYVTAELDFNRAHFAIAQTPLTFSLNSRQPAMYRGLVTFEYCRKISQDIHARNKLMMANATPHALCWLTPLFDVLGTETNWNYNNRWSPMSDTQMLYCRALCGPKPYCFLMNTKFTDFGYDKSERFMKRSLAYGMFPGYFSEDAATGQYFTRPELYDRDRDLFKKYLPLCKQVAEAGWQPLTFAQTDNEKVYIERFGKEPGESIFTVFNDFNEVVDVTVRFRFPTDALPLRFVEAVSGESKTSDSRSLRLTLGPEDVAVLVPEKTK
ncbi:MAG: hypothetical protein FWH27_09240 [Planctomycetaceae bacterium]|nr:hypothetical protein [Planctomycetaceae bacterium]